MPIIRGRRKPGTAAESDAPLEPPRLIHPPETPAAASHGRRRRRIVVGAAVTMVVVVAAVVTYPRVFGPDGPPSCGAGVAKVDGDCVGVSDGSYVFEPQLRDVEGRIRAENDRVKGQRHVTVALMLSMTTTDGGLVPIKRIRAQLEGAYVAQHTANEAGANPRIRLVLANRGSREQASDRVTGQVLDLTGEPDNLVAVVGPGLSTTATVEVLKRLTRQRIPVVGNQITADNLNTLGRGLGGPFPGLVRVNPSASDELTVLADHLRQHRPDLRSAMVVSDSNPDDLYTRALNTNFTTGPLAGYWEAGGRVIQPYDGRPDAPGTRAQFQTIVSNLCGENSPDMAFYAGRALLLPGFVQGLRERNCERDRTFTVVTGSDASALLDTLPAPRDTDAPVSVIYAPLAMPAALADPNRNLDVAQYRRFERAFTQDNPFDPRDLSDGWAIMTHDAVLATSVAIGRSAGQTKVIPLPPDIGSMLRLFNTPTTSVAGAGGTFTFDPETGNVVGRPLFVTELRPDGTLVILGRYSQPH